MSVIAVLALVQAVTLSGRLQGGVTVRPDTVHVGDPFTVSIRVRAPLGASIEFPASPDSGGPVEPLDPVQINTTADSVGVDQTAVYRLAAWRVGSFNVPFADVLVKQEIGSRRVEVSGVFIHVASVLPPDRANIEPRPQRAVFTFGLPWWIWALAAAVAIAILTLLVWLWRRRRRRPTPREAPYVIAEREFNRIEALGLLGAGERTRHVTLMVEALRDYLAAVVTGASTAQTSNELSSAMRRSGLGAYARCAALLSEVDLIKFARRPVTTDRAAALGKEARAIGAAVNAALMAADKAGAGADKVAKAA
ncbi:MAG TPA: hypothetical protein VF128_05270 [Gemmatimonadaceae bacterium]